MALAGGGSRRRKSARRARAQQKSIEAGLRESVKRKGRVTPSIVGTTASRGLCSTRVSKVQKTRDGMVKGMFRVEFQCTVGRNPLKQVLGFKSLHRAQGAMADFIKNAPTRRR